MSQTDLAVQRALDAVDEQAKNPMPTPPIGLHVWWYDRGQRGEGRETAAIVTAIESPGQIQLTIFRPNSIAIHKNGVKHVGDLQHTAPANPQTVNSGSWDYINNKTPPKEHYDFHKKVLTKRRDGILEHHEQEEKARLNREALKQQEDAAKMAAAK